MKKVILIFTTFLLVGCSDFSLENLFNGGKDKSVIIDAKVDTNDGSTSIELTEGSTITFTDEYMIIKTSEGETNVPLSEMNSIIYK